MCRACRVRIAHSTGRRTFTTSTSRRAVPPESPLFVDVPSSFQPLQPYTPTPRGVLPVPREIFPANRPEKQTAKYIQDCTPEPLPENVVPDSATETAKHKARMSAMRRTQLREALTSLLARKKAETSAMAVRSKAKRNQRAALLKQAEREDARLTNVSTPKEMVPTSQSVLEALRAELNVAQRQYETKLANVAAHTEASQARKMDALHTLYMNARNFITTEEQLDSLVKQQFDIVEDKNNNHAQFRTDTTSQGSSMWSYGPPQTINSKVGGKSGPRNSASTYMDAITGGSQFSRPSEKTNLDRYRDGLIRKKISDTSRLAKDQGRLKQIAEKLSGGKI